MLAYGTRRWAASPDTLILLICNVNVPHPSSYLGRNPRDLSVQGLEVHVCQQNLIWAYEN